MDSQITAESLTEWYVFPSLYDGASGSEQWDHVELPKAVANNILQICEARQWEPRLFVAAIWTAIVSHFTDIKIPQIWTSQISLVPDPEPHLEQSSAAELIATSLNDGSTFKTLLERRNWSTISPVGDNQSNTGVVVVTDHGRKRRKIEDEVLVRQTIEKMPVGNDIFLIIHHGKHGPRLLFSYRLTTLSRMHALSILEQFGVLTDSVIQIPSQSVDQLRVLSDRDARQIWQWNSHGFHEANCPMHEIVNKQALRIPQHLAVSAWDGQLTYAELDSLSSKLAFKLRDIGIGPGVFLPVCFEKSYWAVVALLAVNKTGGAFVPLEPSLPLNRLSTIIAQVDAKMTLTSDEQASRLRQAGHSVITVFELIGDKSTEGTSQLLPTIPDLHLPAYCLFTSGSTGQPKGCLVTQAAFAGIAHHAPTLHLEEGTRALQFASLSFGISLIEIFCALSQGSTVCIPSAADRMNSLAHVIKSMNIQWVYLTPSALGALSPSDFSCVKTMIISGEPIQQSQASLWASKVRLMQTYGLTEWSGVFCVSEQIKSADPGELNLGHPVNGRFWLVDPNNEQRLQPIGATAELMIEGPSLSEGYLNNPERTAASFISSHPSWAQNGSRIGSTARFYKTGDLVRYNLDGSITHMGRKDHQVKIRGQRVEIGELEYHLRQLFPTATDVIADLVLPTGSNSIPTLAAFIFQESDTADENTGILEEPSPSLFQKSQSAKQSLREILPSYMIPTIFLPLRRLPRTVSGKKDRRRLRQEVAELTWDQWKRYMTESTTEGEESQMQALSTDTEHTVAQIWAELFGVSPDQIGANDDFYALGGDSVIAMRATALAREKGLSLTVSDIFDFPKLTDLAEKVTPLPESAVEGDNQSGDNRSTILLVSDEIRQLCVARVRDRLGLQEDSDIEDVLPATEIQSFFSQRGAIESYCFFLEGNVDPIRLRDACHVVVQKHSILRTILTKNTHGLFQVVLKAIDLQLQLFIASKDLSTLCKKICPSTPAESLHLDRLIVRFILASEERTDRHAFIVQLSHVQYDAISLHFLFDDLVAAYNGASLSPGLHFSDFIHRRAQQQSEGGYKLWREYLAGSSMTQLGGGRNKPIVITPEAELVHATTALTPLPVPPHRITLATVVKAAWALVLGQLTNQTDVVFGQVVNGRTSVPGIDKILGPCINMTPFRVQLQSTMTVLDYLVYVQRQHMKMEKYDYIEFPDIVKNSTSWKPGVDFATVCQHQNIDLEFHLQFDGTKTIESTSFFKRDRSDTRVLSTPSLTHLDLVIITPPQAMNCQQASLVVQRLGDTVKALCQNPDMALSSLISDIKLKPLHGDRTEEVADCIIGNWGIFGPIRALFQRIWSPFEFFFS